MIEYSLNYHISNLQLFASLKHASWNETYASDLQIMTPSFCIWSLVLSMNEWGGRAKTNLLPKLSEIAKVIYLRRTLQSFTTWPPPTKTHLFFLETFHLHDVCNCSMRTLKKNMHDSYCAMRKLKFGVIKEIILKNLHNIINHK